MMDDHEFGDGERHLISNAGRLAESLPLLR
jgi:hypothetical protein